MQFFAVFEICVIPSNDIGLLSDADPVDDLFKVSIISFLEITNAGFALPVKETMRRPVLVNPIAKLLIVVRLIGTAPESVRHTIVRKRTR